MAQESAEALDREIIFALLSNGARDWVRELQIHQKIDSTNSHLMRHADDGIDGVVCLAEAQTGGRGRRGRTWLTPAGRGIALSLGHAMHMPLAEIAPLSLVVGVAVADALERIGVPAVRLKWPNDVLINGTKVGGILVEVANVAKPIAVIGVGINIGAGAELAAQLGFGVGDLRDVDRAISRNVVVAALVDSIVDFTGAFERDGFAPLRETWERLHVHQNQSVQIQTADRLVHGFARGVTSNGELRLETEAGLRCFNSGEVSLRSN